MALSSEQLWLIVAAKDDRVARSLTGALRMDGDRAILIDTVAMLEEYAATTALCVVVLSRDGPPPDLLAATSKLRFAAHIPIVTDLAYALPAGPWANTIVLDEVDDTALVEQLHAHAQEAVANDTLKARESDLAPPPKLPLTKSERKARRLRRLSIASIIINVIILISNLGPLLFGHSNTHSYHYQPPPSYPLGVAYSVHVPGTCDKTATVNWYGTSKDATICRQDGVIMERDNWRYSDMTRFSVNEDNPSDYFGIVYSVQATMQFIQSDKTTCMGLDTSEQPGNDLSSVTFYVCADGHWQANLLLPSGSFLRVIDSGMLAQPQTTYTMRVTIRDATMSMQINDVQITTLPNPGFITTSTVALANTEFGNSTFVSQILFSDFSVQPGTPVN